ncbi:MAG: hypothetical protein AUI10_02800 [Actinobacteria bacterium 13_2_20CM_2_72_6]|jgi:hypothetical protein|nr:MAG: hypothetical protein AUI10_02800 [Actinobacteria bacterium 13_2_20CM_2_72_6]
MRYYSVPERLGVAGLGAAAAAFAYPSIVRVTGFGLPCPLRTLTGVPCPLCGMTTAATSLAAGRPDAALAANPFLYGLAVLVLAGAGLVAVRGLGLTGPPRPWPAAGRRPVSWVVAGLAAASWLYQLHRSDFF